MTSTNKWPKQRLLRAEHYSLLGVRNEITDIKKDYISIDNENNVGKKYKYNTKNSIRFMHIVIGPTMIYN